MLTHCPKVSIIIPVYNVEKYVGKCLESVSAQTYENIEIICVNDGSPDSSEDIIRNFAEKDSRFKIINKENGGLSSARNAGLDIAQGEYVMFVDSDDWIEKETCLKAVEAMEENSCDLVIWPYQKEYGEVSTKKIIFVGDRVFDEEECRKLHRRTIGMYKNEWKHPENADALAPACIKLLKRSVIEENSIRFVDNSIIGPWEDGFFTLQYLEHTKKAVFLDETFYHYRKGVGVTSRYNPNLAEKWKSRQQILKKYIDDNGLDDTYIQALRNRNSWNLFSLCSNSMRLSGKKAYGEIKKIISELEFRNDLKTLELEYLPLKWKVLYISAGLKLTPVVFLLFSYIKKRRE